MLFTGPHQFGLASMSFLFYPTVLNIPPEIIIQELRLYTMQLSASPLMNNLFSLANVPLAPSIFRGENKGMISQTNKPQTIFPQTNLYRNDHQSNMKAMAHAYQPVGRPYSPNTANMQYPYSNSYSNTIPYMQSAPYQYSPPLQSIGDHYMESKFQYSQKPEKLSPKPESSFLKPESSLVKPEWSFVKPVMPGLATNPNVQQSIYLPKNIEAYLPDYDIDEEDFNPPSYISEINEYTDYPEGTSSSQHDELIYSSRYEPSLQDDWNIDEPEVDLQDDDFYIESAFYPQEESLMYESAFQGNVNPHMSYSFHMQADPLQNIYGPQDYAQAYNSDPLQNIYGTQDYAQAYNPLLTPVNPAVQDVNNYLYSVKDPMQGYIQPAAPTSQFNPYQNFRRSQIIDNPQVLQITPTSFAQGTTDFDEFLINNYYLPSQQMSQDFKKASQQMQQNNQQMNSFFGSFPFPSFPAFPTFPTFPTFQPFVPDYNTDENWVSDQIICFA